MVGITQQRANSGPGSERLNVYRDSASGRNSQSDRSGAGGQDFEQHSDDFIGGLRLSDRGGGPTRTVVMGGRFRGRQSGLRLAGTQNLAAVDFSDFHLD